MHTDASKKIDKNKTLKMKKTTWMIKWSYK